MVVRLRWCSTRSRRRICILALVTLLVFLLVARLFIRKRVECSVQKATEELRELCLHARKSFLNETNSLSVGSACEKLCSPMTAISQCLTRYEGGKRVWLVRGFEGRDDVDVTLRSVVVKRAKNQAEELPPAFFRNAQRQEGSNSPILTLFEELLDPAQ